MATSSEGASMEQLERLVGKVVMDPEFRDYFLDNPQAAAGSVGITLSEDQIQKVHALDRETVEALGLLFTKEVEESGTLNAIFWN